jgi:hypothetical protein
LKLAAMSESNPTGTNSVVLKMKAAIASITTRSQAVLRETVSDCIEIYDLLEGVKTRLASQEAF